MAGTKQTLIQGPDETSDAEPHDSTGSEGERIAARVEPVPSHALVKGSDHAPVKIAAEPPISLQSVPRPGRYRKLKRFAALVVVLAALVYGARYGHYWLTHGQFVVSTDNAYVRADMSVISPRVGGYAIAVIVAENAQVQAGELLVRIDPEDYEIAVAAARGKIETQDATIARIGRQMQAQKAAVARAEAQLKAAEASAKRATSDLERIQLLAARAFSSKKALGTAEAERARADAEVESARAAILAAEANTEVLGAKREEARRLKAEYGTALRKAERDLAATEIRAPFDGVVGNLAVKQGQLLQPGSRLLALVPLERIYVEANFKETQIERLKVGQPVVIETDAYADRTVVGRIESIAPAAGSEFSLLPPENATGNFTKIIQRVPVRISLPRDAVGKHRLRPGLSVLASVDTLDPKAPRPTVLGVLGLQRVEQALERALEELGWSRAEAAKPAAR